MFTEEVRRGDPFEMERLMISQQPNETTSATNKQCSIDGPVTSLIDLIDKSTTIANHFQLNSKSSLTFWMACCLDKSSSTYSSVSLYIIYLFFSKSYTDFLIFLTLWNFLYCAGTNFAKWSTRCVCFTFLCEVCEWDGVIEPYLLLSVNKIFVILILRSQKLSLMSIEEGYNAHGSHKGNCPEVFSHSCFQIRDYIIDLA